MLKIILLRSKIDALKSQLKKADEKSKDFESRSAELQKRHAELEAAVNEMTEETSQEERDAVTGQVETYEADNAEYAKDLEEHNTAREGILREIEELEKELSALEEKQQASNVETQSAEERADDKIETRKTRDNKRSMTMNRRFKDITFQERQAFVENNNVREFLNRCRESMSQTRAIGNVGLTIPDEFIDFIKAEVPEKSKTYKLVRVKRVKGNGRAVVLGAPVEAFWTELCAELNEIDLGFGRVPVTPHKLGAYVAVCNAMIEMSDIDLAAEVIDALGDAMGYAYDKAIAFGRGNGMPLGFATRLIQTEQPADYPADALPWENLSATHVKNGVANVKDLILGLSAAESKYTRGDKKFWIMNEQTKAALIANFLMKTDSNGRLVSGLYGTDDVLPVIGGRVIVLDFVPTGVIAGGYGDAYLFAESRDWKFAESTHAHFIEDETLYKVTTYADGRPAIPQAFAAVGLDGVIGAGETVATQVAGVTFAGN